MIIELLRRRGENRENSIVWSGQTVSCAPVPCRRRTSMRLCLSEDLVGACLEPRALVTRLCGTVVWCIRAWDGARLSWVRGREESRGGGGGGGPLCPRPLVTCEGSRWSQDTWVTCLSISGVDTQSAMFPTLMLLCCEGDIAQHLALSRGLFHGVIFSPLMFDDVWLGCILTPARSTRSCARGGRLKTELTGPGLSPRGENSAARHTDVSTKN